METIPTLRDLARDLCLGKSTIQRALAGAKEIKEATRKRVAARALELGYRKNTYFAVLSEQCKRRKASGILIHYLFGRAESPKNLMGGRDISAELQHFAPNYGLEVAPVDLSKFSKTEIIPRILFARGSVGLITGICDQRLYTTLQAFNKVSILSYQRQDPEVFHSVSFSVSGPMRLCWKKLWHAGHRRIGFALVQHQPQLPDDRDRLATALGLMKEYLPAEDWIPPLVERPYVSDPVAFRSWLDLHQPEAVISFRSCYWNQCANDLKRPIPLLSLHANNLDPQASHIPGTIEQHPFLAKELLRRMESMIRTNERGTPEFPLQVFCEPTWFEGDGIPQKKPRETPLQTAC